MASKRCRDSEKNGDWGEAAEKRGYMALGQEISYLAVVVWHERFGPQMSLTGIYFGMTDGSLTVLVWIQAQHVPNAAPPP